jgi:hypothetical protein
MAAAATMAAVAPAPAFPRPLLLLLLLLLRQLLSLPPAVPPPISLAASVLSAANVMRLTAVRAAWATTDDAFRVTSTSSFFRPARCVYL